MIGIPDIPNFTQPQVNLGVGFGGAVLLNQVFDKKIWGIVNEFGIPILLADSVVGMSYDAGNTISNMPIEKGSFASYNKVNAPSMATVTMAKSSGGALGRGAFHAQLEALLKSTIKFNVITPEFVYMNYSMIGINFSREAQDGCTLIKFNVELQEVLESKIDYAFEEVAAPEDASTVDGGARQASDQSNNSILLDAANKIKDLL